MADGFCQSLLRISMAQICQELGWHAIHSTPCDLLTDILQRYLQQLASISHEYAEQYGRTQPNLDDLGLAFRQMGISLYELENYVKDVDPIPFKYDIPQFPLKRQNNLQHPIPGSRDDRERLDYIPAHLPPIIGLSDDFGEPIGHHRDSISSASGMAMDTDSPESRLLSPGGNSHTSPRGEKRETSSPLFSEQAMKRLRLDGDGTPQELTAVSMSISGELTPKREGRLPIATTPPQRALKVAIPGADIPVGSAQKAITDRLLIKSEDTGTDRPQPKSPKGARPLSVDPKSPKSKTPVPQKPKPQTKSPKHLLFSPNASSKYPLPKPKAISGLTPLSADKSTEFQFPPPKSPKGSLSSLGSLHVKKSQEKPQDPTSKQEKAALKVYDFDDDDLDSKPASAAREPQSSPTEPSGPYKEPSAFLMQEDTSKVQTASAASISASIDAVVSRNMQEVENRSSPIKVVSVKKKLGKEKDKSKTLVKDKTKLKPKLKTKKSKDDIPSYYDSVGSLTGKENKSTKKHSKTPVQVVKRKNYDADMYGKTPKLVIKTGREKSESGEPKVIKKKIKSSKLKETDKQKHIKVKKLKQKSLKYKVKSKSPNRGTVPSAAKPRDDFSPDRLKPIGKLNIIKSSGSSLQFKIARPTEDSSKRKEKKVPKEKLKKGGDKQKLKTVKKIKTSSHKEKSDSTEKTDSSDKEKKHVIKDKKKSKEKKSDKSQQNSEKKAHIKSETSEKEKTPLVVPKITFKLGATPAGGDSPKIVIKTTVQEPPSDMELPLFTPTIPKISIPLPSKKSKDSTKSSKSEVETKLKVENKSKTDSKLKADSKTKQDAKQKSAKKKEKEIEKEKEKQEREREKKEKEKEKEKERKEKEKEKERKEKEKEKERKEKEKERKEKEKKEKERKEREKEKEREMERERKEKEKREREKEKEKEKAKEKLKEEVKPKTVAEVSPYDFDVASPTPTIKAVKKESTPVRKEPKPGIFAPSVPSPTNVKPATPTSKSSTSSKALTQSAIKITPLSSAQPQKSNVPTPPPTKAALKALPPSTKAGKASFKQKEKEKGKSAPKPASPPPAAAAASNTASTAQPEGPCTLIMETAGTVITEDGEKIWICPGCKKQDDGSPMVGCDECDDWYHWVCVGIEEEPTEESWFCPRCSNKTKGKKKRGKKR